MGQKVNPKIFRISVTSNWDSKWFSKKNFAKQLRQDVVIRKWIKETLRDSGVSHVEIERNANSMTITIYTLKPGIIIGRSGAGIEDLKKQITKKFLNKQATKIDAKQVVNINIMEVQRPNLNAQVIANAIAIDIEKRMPFRRAMKQAMQKVDKAGAKGVRVIVAGRLNGAEIARSEMLTKGSLPLQTLRADIDYARTVARTVYGAIGIKVWIYRGEVFQKQPQKPLGGPSAEEKLGPIETK